MNALRLIRIVPEIILERNYFFWALILAIFAQQYWHLDLWTAERSVHGMEEKRRLYLLYCYIDIFAEQYWHLDLWTAERSFHGMEEKRRQRQSLTQSEEIRAGGHTLGSDLGLGTWTWILDRRRFVWTTVSSVGRTLDFRIQANVFCDQGSWIQSKDIMQ